MKKLTKSFADVCLEDAKNEGFDCCLSEYVPELARRLKRACEKLKLAAKRFHHFDLLVDALLFEQLADELEAMPEEK